MLKQTRVESGVARLVLSPHEAAQASRIVGELLEDFPDAAGPQAWRPELLRAAALSGHGLPRRLRAFLSEIRERESAAAFVVCGFPVSDRAIGPTPDRWARQPDPLSTRPQEAWLVLCGSLLGELFGWATQQAGALIHDIAPTRADEHKQVGSSSAELLWWHTEEAFHPLKCDYLGLLCLRNHDRVPTTFATIGDVELDDETRRVLFEERFVIRPDDSHLTRDSDDNVDPEVTSAAMMSAARRRIKEMDENPRRVSLLYGAVDHPYLSIDPFYMDAPTDDPPARRAYEALCQAIDSHTREVVVMPGEILFIDNYRAVHGRRPFRARYDGTDRWLKRINITRDLRKSRAFRATSESRVVF